MAMFGKVEIEFNTTYNLAVDIYGPICDLRIIGHGLARSDWRRQWIAEDIRTLRRLRQVIRTIHNQAFYPDEAHNLVR